MGCSASISIKEPRDLIEVCEKKNIAYVKKFLTVANIERFDYLALDYAKRDPLVLKTFLDSDLVQGKDLIERKEYFDRKALIAFLKHPKGSNHIHMGYIVWTDDCEMLKTSLDHYGLLPDYDYLDLVEKTYKKSVNLVRILMTHSRGLKNISINKCIITGLEYLKEYVDFVVDHLLNHKCKEFDSYDICIYAIRIGNEHLLSKYLPFCEEKIADEFSNKRVIEFEKGLGADVVYTLFNNFYLASTSNNLCYHKKDWVYMKIEPTDIKRNRVLSSLFKYEKSKFEMKEGIKLLSPSYIYEHVKNNAKPYVKEVHKNLLDMPVDVIDFILSSYVF